MDDRTSDHPPIRTEQRRSSRFSVVVPVEVKWQEPSGKIVKQAAQAKEVNAQGGLLEMKIYPWVGGDLELTNLLSGQTTQARLVGTRRSKDGAFLDRKSTRLNSSHGYISYAVFCLKKKNNTICAVTR